MRILDEDGDKAIHRVTLYLTKSEAAELKSTLESLLAEPGRHHEHVPDADYSRELTVCVYDLNMIDQFDERSKKILIQGI
jgi:hypothetical protein